MLTITQTRRGFVVLLNGYKEVFVGTKNEADKFIADEHFKDKLL